MEAALGWSVSKWSDDDYLISKAGDQYVSVEHMSVYSSPCHRFEFRNGWQVLTMRLEDFLKSDGFRGSGGTLVADGSLTSDSDLYLYQLKQSSDWILSDKRDSGVVHDPILAQLLADFGPVPMLANVQNSQYSLSNVNLWMSNTGIHGSVTSRLRKDRWDNLFVVTQVHCCCSVA